MLSRQCQIEYNKHSASTTRVAMIDFATRIDIHANAGTGRCGESDGVGVGGPVLSVADEG
jgi:hypothetical protein